MLESMVKQGHKTMEGGRGWHGKWEAVNPLSFFRQNNVLKKFDGFHYTKTTILYTFLFLFIYERKLKLS